jgi:hypothetical protein
METTASAWVLHFRRAVREGLVPAPINREEAVMSDG